MKITIVQFNPIIGDLKNNSEEIISLIDRNRSSSMIIFPELALTGYPPRDQLYQNYFIKLVHEKIDLIASKVQDHYVLLGSPFYQEDKLYNVALVLRRGMILKIVPKCLLPNYDVFDEERYFSHPKIEAVTLRDHIIEVDHQKIWVSICEDIWSDPSYPSKRDRAWLPSFLKSEKIDLMVNLSASPFNQNKLSRRIETVRETVRLLEAPLLYVNQVGANDDLIFDGRSFLMRGDQQISFMLEGFRSAEYTFDLKQLLQARVDLVDDLPADFFQALVLGVKDYLFKTGFNQVAIGLSGGIDSALVAAIATKALGAQNVIGIALPSQYSSKSSELDAAELAKNLGIKFLTFPVEETIETIRRNLTQHLKQSLTSLADQNLQARVRGNFLMTYSNQTGCLLLATGNKSELAMGYSTLYGDLCGALLVIGDLLKTEVYRISDWINQNAQKIFPPKKIIIPKSIITKEPTAELKPNQKDSDSLPPYETLDPILELLLVKNRSVDEMVSTGLDRELVKSVKHAVDLNEYKRFQAPLVLKLTNKSFGRGRRIPIVRK